MRARKGFGRWHAKEALPNLFELLRLICFVQQVSSAYPHHRDDRAASKFTNCNLPCPHPGQSPSTAPCQHKQSTTQPVAYKAARWPSCDQAGAVISADARARNADALSLPEQLPVASYRLSLRQTTTVLLYSGGRSTRPRRTSLRQTRKVYDLMRPSSFVINALRWQGRPRYPAQRSGAGGECFLRKRVRDVVTVGD